MVSRINNLVYWTHSHCILSPLKYCWNNHIGSRAWHIQSIDQIWPLLTARLALLGHKWSVASPVTTLVAGLWTTQLPRSHPKILLVVTHGQVVASLEVGGGLTPLQPVYSTAAVGKVWNYKYYCIYKSKLTTSNCCVTFYSVAVSTTRGSQVMKHPCLRGMKQFFVFKAMMRVKKM